MQTGKRYCRSRGGGFSSDALGKRKGSLGRDTEDGRVKENRSPNTEAKNIFPVLSSKS